MVGVVCFEYRHTDIGPYNELGIVVALNEPWFLTNFPGRAVVAGMRRRQQHAWVQHLPVTTEIARAGGVELYNYPKFIAEIAFEQADAHRFCGLHEGQEHILTLTGKRIRTTRSERLQLFSHLWMQGQPQSSEFKVNATELGTSFRPDAASLELGDRHPIAQELADLLLSRRPTQYGLRSTVRGDPVRPRTPHPPVDQSQPGPPRRPRAGPHRMTTCASHAARTRRNRADVP